MVFVPADTIHTGGATLDADVVFFTVKDASHSLHGIKVADGFDRFRVHITALVLGLHHY